MKRLSIKLRVTLWFTVFMMLLVIMVSGILLFTGKKLQALTIQKQLMETVDKIEDLNRNQVAGKIAEPVDNIYVSMYDAEGKLLGGIIPSDFEEPAALTKDTPRRIKSGDQEWFVYDVQRKKDHGNFLWIRGVLPLQDTDESGDMFLRLLIFALPFVVIAIALLGYAVIDRAFRPIHAIIQTAEKIGEGADLSQRIDLEEGKDEIHTLARTFNNTFQKLEAYFENEKRFTADASHELRTPTSVILAQCEYALEHAGTMEEAREALMKIRQQASKMSSLIANLLMLARMDNGQYTKWNMERINLSELTEVIIEQQSELAEERGIKITKETEPDIYISAEETMMMRMLINLIENGIQYGKKDGYVNIRLKKTEEDIELKIMDNGIGIAPEHLNHIWERFYQADPSRNNVQNNTGLGLAMVKWIVEAHKGRIGVQSELGKGTVFTVILPYCKI